MATFAWNLTFNHIKPHLSLVNGNCLTFSSVGISILSKDFLNKMVCKFKCI